jgi:CubicO group peptidase (beta-lactamase class C family)
VAEGLHTGGQLAVSLAGERVVDEAFGEATPGRPMRRDDLVAWLSAGKPLTAVAIGRLWEGDLLDLDDPVARHLPEFAVNGKDAITVRHLLTHTAGLRMLDVGWPTKAWADIVAGICAARPEPRWPPGGKAGYHLASSWFLLAEIVRRLDGRRFERYVREEILEPLGMADCWVGMPAGHVAAYGGRIVPTWNTESEPPTVHPWHEERYLTEPSPASGGRGPMGQLLHFYEMLLGRGRHGGRVLLRPPTVDALVAHQRTGMFDHTFRTRLDWGLGFVVDSRHYGDPNAPYGFGEHASSRTFGHSGYRSTVAFADPERQLAAALMVNGTPGDAEHRQRFHAALTALYEDLGLAARA